jgi:DNA-directed RNA polymerase specialized sigma24 family protein
MSGETLPLRLPLPRFRTREGEATALYRELRKPLVRYLMCLGLSSDEAQDVVQDAFVSLQKHLAAGGSQENIRSWLYRVAHNHARNRQTSYDRRFSAPLGGQGDPSTQRAGTRMSAAARRGIAVPRNRRSLGNSDLDRG